MFRATFPPVIAFGLIAGLSANPARAADYLRGSYAGETAPKQAVAQDWAGFYVGGHLGYSAVQAAATSTSLTAPSSQLYSLPGNVTTFSPPGFHKSGTTYGGFAGVNFLWDDVIMGVEADYTHAGFGNSGSTALLTLTDNGNANNRVNATLTGSAKLQDAASLRGRVGYAIGMIMPFVTLGAALGNIDSRQTYSGLASTDAGATWTAYSRTTNKNGLALGAAFGAGIEAQIIPNTFVRAEWQTLQFAKSGARPEINTHTGRLGAGVKF